MSSGLPPSGTDGADSDQGSTRSSPRDSRAIFFEIPAGANAPRTARQLLDDVMALWDCDDVNEVAALLTSELVTNVVRHARTDLLLEVSLRASLLRVAATDEDPTIPQLGPVRPSPTAESGRGLHLINTLAHRWGIESRGNGKTVWFDVVVRERHNATQPPESPGG
jgi:anti-sigma regulatory factor (Ser/Thr protein kinase)